MKTKSIRKSLSLLCCAVLLGASVSLPRIAVSAAEIDQNVTHEAEAGMYCYHFEAELTNPCNEKDMDKDSIYSFYFDFGYLSENGAGSKQTYRFDMSWDGTANRNSAFLKKNFIRANDNTQNISFDFWADGKLTDCHIHLNMDGGERLSFTVKQVTCGGIQVNTNTDYVSSAYWDSDAYLGFSMEPSVCQDAESLLGNGASAVTELEVRKLISDLQADVQPEMILRDQYGAILMPKLLDKILLTHDGDINQNFRHSDEVSFYPYKLVLRVTNPINMNDADKDAVEAFTMDFTYRGENGLVDTDQHYQLDMSWDGSRNQNERFLRIFRKSNDDEYSTEMIVWVPGIVSNIDILLNMAGGERLSFTVEAVMLGDFTVNRATDYVSSAYWDSEAEIPCFVPSPQISLAGMDEAQISDTLHAVRQNSDVTLFDQYGVKASDALIKKAGTSFIEGVYQFTLNETAKAWQDST